MIKVIYEYFDLKFFILVGKSIEIAKSIETYPSICFKSYSKNYFMKLLRENISLNLSNAFKLNIFNFS